MNPIRGSLLVNRVGINFGRLWRDRGAVMEDHQPALRSLFENVGRENSSGNRLPFERTV